MSPIEPPIAGEPAGDPVAFPDVRSALVALSVRAQAVGALMVELGVGTDDARRGLQERARAAGLTVDEVARAVLALYAAVSDEEPDGAPATG